MVEFHRSRVYTALFILLGSKSIHADAQSGKTAPADRIWFNRYNARSGLSHGTEQDIAQD